MSDQATAEDASAQSPASPAPTNPSAAVDSGPSPPSTNAQEPTPANSPNELAANTPGALLSGQPPSLTPARRYQLQLNQATDRKRQQMLLQQAQAAQGRNGSAGP